MKRLFGGTAIEAQSHSFWRNISRERAFSRYMAPIIDKVLGLRCASYGYQYSEIVGSLSSVYFCGGDCVEDVTSHLNNLLKKDGALTCGG